MAQQNTSLCVAQSVAQLARCVAQCVAQGIGSMCGSIIPAVGGGSMCANMCAQGVAQCEWLKVHARCVCCSTWWLNVRHIYLYVRLYVTKKNVTKRNMQNLRHRDNK